MASTDNSPPSSGLTGASDRIREAAKWLIASFAAVGAALIAGTQFSSIGRLESAWRFWVAAGAGLVALVGIAWAILSAAEIATASTVSLKELAGLSSTDLLRQTVDDPTLLEGQSDVGTLRESYISALERRRATFQSYYSEPSGPNELAAKLADARVVTLEQAVTNVLDVGSFVRLSTRFHQSVQKIFAAGLVAAVAIGIFVWAVNGPTTAASQQVIASVDQRKPQAVIVQLQPSAAQLIDAELGASCSSQVLSGTALSRGAAGVVVLTTATSTCESRLLTLSGKEATIVSGASPQPIVVPTSQPSSHMHDGTRDGRHPHGDAKSQN